SAYGFHDDSKAAAGTSARIRERKDRGTSILGFASIRHPSAPKRGRVSRGTGTPPGRGGAHPADIRCTAGCVIEWGDGFIHHSGPDGAGKFESGQNLCDRFSR